MKFKINIFRLFYIYVIVLLYNTSSCGSQLLFDQYDLSAINITIEETCDIIDDDGDFVGYYEQLCRTFVCKVPISNAKQELSILWYFNPDNNFQEGKEVPITEGSDSIERFPSEVTSTVNLTLIKESGCVGCQANFHNASVLSPCYYINSFKEIKITEEKVEYVVSSDGTELNVSWTFIVEADPRPYLFLFCNKTNVGVYYDDSLDLERVNRTRNVSYVIEEAKDDFYLHFDLIAANKYQTKKFNLTYLPTFLYIEISSNCRNKMYCEVECSVTSVLPAQIMWNFICETENCSKQNKTQYFKLLEDLSNKSGLKTVSYVAVNSSFPGKVSCFSNNTLEQQQSFNYTIGRIPEAENGIDIYQDEIVNSEDISNLQNNTTIFHVKSIKNISLTCVTLNSMFLSDVKWFRLTNEENNKIEFSQNYTLMKKTIFTYEKQLFFPSRLHFRTVLCQAQNKNGTWISKKVVISYSDRDSGEKQWIYYVVTVSGVIVVIVIVVLVMFRKFRIHQKIQQEWATYYAAGLNNFKKGAIEHLNPNLTIDAQANLLPYDNNYEISLEQLKLGKQIGSGAFGIVVKGELTGFTENQDITVAVKMVNRTVGDVYIKALASEIKIMMYLGKHINIINLLGVCTKNLLQRELYMVVEYCRFGNLREYLLNNRSTFINQINAETIQFDFEIGGKVLSRPEFTYITPCYTNCSLDCSSSSADNENEMENHSSCTDDYNGTKRPLCSRDLVLWSLQIACGMEYLSLRNVLHGDLAARNILLTDGNMVKICDFGLSKQMYERDVYKKNGDEMLPVKWLAIESITDKIFSVQSDVWSFGIVLWELFSLGSTPYPGIEYNEAFCEKLLNGYRMKQPKFATDIIYELMLHCWSEVPDDRPNFTQLSQKFSSLLDDRTTEHYIDMNSGYVKMNARKFGQKNVAGYVNVVPTSVDEENDLNV